MKYPEKIILKKMWDKIPNFTGKYQHIIKVELKIGDMCVGVLKFDITQ